MNRLKSLFAVVLLSTGLHDAVQAGIGLEQEFVVGMTSFPVKEASAYVLDGEGQQRLVLLGSEYLAGFSRSPGRGTWEQSFFIQGRFRHVALADIDGDAVNDLLAISGFKVEAFNSRTGDHLRSLTLDAYAEELISQDLDGVPGDEWIVLTDQVDAYRGDELLWTFSDDSVKTLLSAIDGQHEVYVSTDEEVIVLDPRTGTEQRRLGVEWATALIQADSDPAPEILSHTLSSLRVVDGIDGTTQWQRNVQFVREIEILDVDADNRHDLAVRISYHGWDSLKVLNGSTGEPLSDERSLQAQGPLASTTIGCWPELIVIENSSPPTLETMDPLTLATITKTSFASSAPLGFEIADISGNGTNSLIVRQENVITAVSLQPVLTFPELRIEGPIRDMVAVQLDDDAAVELVVASDSEGAVFAIDLATHERMWTASKEGDEITHSVAAADLNGDGDVEIVTGSYVKSAGGSFVSAFDGATGQRLWRSFRLSNVVSLLVADIDMDGRSEIIVLDRQIGLIYLNSADGSVRGFEEFSGGTAIAAGDLDGDQELEIVVATNERILVFDGGVLTRAKKISSDGRITRIRIVDFNGDGEPELWMARRSASEGVRLEVLSGISLERLWISDLLPYILNLEQYEDIQFGDVDNDGETEVVFLSSLTITGFSFATERNDITAPRFPPLATLRAPYVATRLCCATVVLEWDPVEVDQSPPVTYQVFRGHTSSTRPPALVGATRRSDFIDMPAGGAASYRYSVRAVDSAGNISAETLVFDLVEAPMPSCGRRRIVAR